MEESVSIIIFDKEKKRVLLIKRRDIPVWVLPGGGIENGEEPEAAALREAEEETGLKLKIERKVAFYTPANRLTRPTHFYECRVLEGIPQVGPETREIEFFPIDQLPRTLVPFYKTWIDDALLFWPEVLKKKIRKTSYWKFIQYLICHPLLVIQFLLTRMGIHFNR
jgi:8-oxo-dGTP pyrophosphatase MutT (NUDIX family)